MESLAVIFTTSWFWLVPAIAAVAAVIIAIIRIILSRRGLKNSLTRILDKPELAGELIIKRYRPDYLLRNSKLFDSFADRHGPGILRDTGMDELWINRLEKKKNRADFIRVMKYSMDKGLFKCFLVSIENKSLARLLIKLLEDTGDFLYMRKLAMAGRGEEFDSGKARRMFESSLPMIREMTGDPEWASRYFAVKIILNDTEDKSIRALWDSFSDSHPLVRKTVAREFKTDDKEKLYSELNNLILRDPVFEVRKAAHDRIISDFPGRFNPSPENLEDWEMWHVLGLLRDGNKNDENFALSFLDSDNLELRQIAAVYLDRNGALERICGAVDLGDRDDFERKLKLLKNACAVNVASFLSSVKKTDNPAGLLLHAMLLSEAGNKEHITVLAEKVFETAGRNNELPELYRTTLECISKRGPVSALLLMERELNREKNSPESMEIILPLIPERGDNIFVPTLLSLLKTPSFEPKKILRETLNKMPLPLVIPEVLEILRNGRDGYPHSVRIEALKLLGEMKQPYCIQMILENLPMLPIEHAKEFAHVLAVYPGQELINKLTKLLGTVDAKIRASVITMLPVTGDKSFVKEVVKSMKDADPDVRVASVRALVDFNETKMLNETISMLRDPVERVRSEVGRVLGKYGSDKIIKELKDILFDENEVSSVKTAVIEGLAASDSLISVDMLMEKLETENELVRELTDALSCKTEKKEITRIIEFFKDALPNFRERIIKVFTGMKENGEKQLAELLREDISSLNPLITQILEATGYVESNIRKLSHKDPAFRRASAEFLSLVGTKSAFRGIVLAARDPDDEVRVMVIKALEKLAQKDGNEILDYLENDPDKRVRKYTHWALERLRAKAL